MAGDSFTVRFGETFIDFTVSKFLPYKKVVWNVTPKKTITLIACTTQTSLPRYLFRYP
jgi:hypothetical protein